MCKNIVWLFIILSAACQPSLLKQAKPHVNRLRLQDAPFPVGVAVNIEKLKNLPPYRQIVIEEFSSITAENAMKGQHMQPERGRFVWENADYLVDFCQTYGKQLHGHTLVWHLQQPQWLKNFQGDSAAWEQVMKEHIQTIVGRYKGKVKSWDVVNEAIDDKDTSHLRKTIWTQHLGEDYVARAFQYAHQADPDALLFYNDYGIENNNGKLAAVLKMVDSFKKRGIPVHGIGLQMHINHQHPMEGIAYAIEQIRKRGLKVHISELDLSVNPEGADISLTDELLQKQKEKIRDITALYKSLPEENQYALTFWGVADADTWIRNWFKRKDWPLLYDDNYQPKPAYQGFMEGMKIMTNDE
jgi:endo-1,4-beta-xylanase